ncbi:EVE domain-containing protein [Chitinimonas sp.]|uniref:EVE domain-containing protein n=1 Tax=Chitinimonas sp. TaxID=1934313 RepID=UPI002F91D708
MDTRYWIAVASAEHVARGKAGGFMQVCHGKVGPLRRLQPGDQVVYYSPTGHFGGKDRLQAFTAIGTVEASEPYPYPMTEDFCPYRRDIAWQPGETASILPLLDQLSFSRGQHNWGYALRFGLVQITAEDMALIAAAMGLGVTAP